MPSPNEDINDNDVDILVSDQSLTDMLASHADNQTEPNDDLMVRMEAKLVASEIELQAERDERISLQHQVELLMSEIDNMKKTDKNKKCEIRKLLNENDKLKKDASKLSGIRKYTSAQNNVSGDKATQTTCANGMPDKISWHYRFPAISLRRGWARIYFCIK